MPQICQRLGARKYLQDFMFAPFTHFIVFVFFVELNEIKIEKSIHTSAFRIDM